MEPPMMCTYRLLRGHRLVCSYQASDGLRSEMRPPGSASQRYKLPLCTICQTIAGGRYCQNLIPYPSGLGET